jgi:acyl-CoA thioesterase-1
VRSRILIPRRNTTLFIPDWGVAYPLAWNARGNTLMRMRSWLTHDIGGAPRWLLVISPLIVAAVLFVAFARPVAATPGGAEAGSAPLPAFTPVPYPTTVRFKLPKNPKMVVLGDSYTQGFAASPMSKGYAYLIGRDLGWKTTVLGVGGTGFTYDGPNGLGQNYGTRIKALIASGAAAPDVIVLEGSQNDYRSVGAITKTVVADVKLLQKAYPKAAIVLFGPAAPQPLQTQLSAIDAADAAAALQLAIPYISPFQENWITTANTKRYGYSDGAHLNTAGHRYLADRFLQDFRPLFGLR